MVSFIFNGSLGSIQGPDGAYLLVNTPQGQPPSIQPGNVNVGLRVGSAPWGPKGTPLFFGSPSDQLSKIGPSTTATYDLPTSIQNGLAAGVGLMWGVRESDGTDLAAQLIALDQTSFATLQLTGTGTVALGKTVPISLVNGSVTVSLTYTMTAADVAASDPIASVMANVAALIASSAAVQGSSAFLEPPVMASAHIIQLTASIAGTAGNAITAAGGISTPSGFTISPTSATNLAGGGTGSAQTLGTFLGFYTGSYINAATVTFSMGSNFSPGSPTITATLRPNNGQASEVYANIVAYATAGAGYSAATFKANLAAAINGAPPLSPQRPASSWFRFTAGSATLMPQFGVAFAVSTPGTDGAAFGSGPASASLAMLGTNGIPKTGMYALSGIAPGGVLCFSGNSDLVTVGAPAIAWGQSNNVFFFGQFATATQTTANIALKQQLGLASPYFAAWQDFAEFTDSTNGIVGRRWPTAEFAADRTCTTRPDISPANTTVLLVTGTERLSVVSNVNEPYYPDEVELLEQAGINIITTPATGGFYWAIRHNKNSMGQASQQGNLAYTRMVQFIANSLSVITLGLFVGGKNDPDTRADVRATLNGFGSTLTNPSDPILTSWGVVCDLTNNTPQVLQNGLMVAQVDAGLTPIVDKFVLAVSAAYNTVAVSVPTIPQFQPPG